MHAQERAHMHAQERARTHTHIHLKHTAGPRSQLARASLTREHYYQDECCAAGLCYIALVMLVAIGALLLLLLLLMLYKEDLLRSTRLGTSCSLLSIAIINAI
jgi:hypothetical protein